jgi:hypothetical protein
MGYKTVLYFLLGCCRCFAGCTQHIPGEIKQVYAWQFQTAFALQSEGMSMSAMANFEDAYRKAVEAGEPIKKLQALRHFLVWYRTYGYYLGLIKKDPKIYGHYIGNGQYSPPYISKRSLNSGSTFSKMDPERDARIRDVLFGTSEIISGLICFYIGPPPLKYASPFMVLEGSTRIWDALNSIWLLDATTKGQFELVKKELKEASES